MGVWDIYASGLGIWDLQLSIDGEIQTKDMTLKLYLLTGVDNHLLTLKERPVNETEYGSGG
jgi:hypothetical protein